MRAEGIEEPRNLEEQALMLIGKDIYERLIKGYTEKQWGRKCTELPAFIIKRLPVRMVFDNNYFNDSYQGIPKGGYNKLVDGLLAGVETRINEDFFDYIRLFDASNNVWKLTRKGEEQPSITARKIVYTGQLDEFFDFKLGKLNFRTVKFEQETLNMSNYQGNAVVNYTEAEVPYTRIIEHKHFEMFGNDVDLCPKTVISREYSTEWQEGMEPYYPVNDDYNNNLADQYRSLAAEEPNVLFGGRLAEYKYYDMAPIVENVFTLEI
jgi:UDP-galactopyranose mutase